MLKRIIKSIRKKIRGSPARSNLSEKKQRGQIIILIAVSIIVIVAMVGLLIDGGILFIEYGRLKRAVDAAAVSAANQFREGYTIAQLNAAATQFLNLNQDNLINVQVDTCDTDHSLCTNPRRKIVRVTASRQVRFGFISILGFTDTTITASAESEAASVDVVIVLDSSASMAYEGGGSPDRADDPADDPAQCNPTHSCQPFETIKTIAADFIDQLYFPYDRVSIVTFDRDPHLVTPLTANKSAVLATLNNLRVYQPPVCPTAHGPCRNYDASGNFIGFECPIYRSTGDPSSCTTSNIGGGLRVAANTFAMNPVREDSLWVIIVLAGGPANATDPDLPSFPYGYCPSSTWIQPFCRDASALTRHSSGDPNYDADDYARDMADFAADPENGQGAIIFSIGLGRLVRNTTAGDPDAGEQLLRYMAENAGGSLANHGMYYYAPSTAELRDIFREIASNIATRLTR
jgi:Flp pilus assembly protein TadG